MKELRTSLILLLVLVHAANLSEVTEDQVTFYLRNRELHNKIKLTNNNLGLVNSSKPTRFLVHGWTGSHNTAWFAEATDAYLIKGDYNVIQVDWSEPANEEFYESANNTKAVGHFVGRLISKLVKNYNVSSTNIHVTGHSFGSHVAGFTGKTVKAEIGSRIRQIIALDPSRRPFENDTISEENKLYKEDADIVVAVHTDAGSHGFVSALGTIDFYPDGGAAPQPACETSNVESCSHNIVTDYFTESIANSNGFLSTKCNSYEEYENGSCSNNKNITLGGDLRPDDEGVYYLHTNKQKPYSKE